MSEPDETKQVKATLWTRLSSSNWWWYGTMSPSMVCPPERRPKLWRTDVVVVLLFSIFLLTLPGVFSELNAKAPSDEEIISLSGKVQSVHSKSPHIQLELTDGRDVYAEFPVRFAWGGMKNRTLFDDYERERVLACRNIEIKGRYLRFVPLTRFQIWEIRCNDSTFSIGRDKLREHWAKNRKMNFWIDLGFGILVPGLILIFYFFRERVALNRQISPDSFGRQ